MELDDSCFSRRKCNCSRLYMTAWVFVDVEREFGTLSCTCRSAPPRVCSPSLRHVSYPASQSLMTAVGITFISSMKDSLHCLFHNFCGTRMLTQIRSGPHGNKSIFTSCLTEKMKLNVWINSFKGSVSAEFDGVTELNVKCCV
jgi:hypothetical protein